MSAEAGFVHVFDVGPWTVELTLPKPRPGRVAHALCEWWPAEPDRPLTTAEEMQYRAGVAEALRRARQPG